MENKKLSKNQKKRVEDEIFKHNQEVILLCRKNIKKINDELNDHQKMTMQKMREQIVDDDFFMWFFGLKIFLASYAFHFVCLQLNKFVLTSTCSLT